jgi:hypothetical protein
MKLETGDILHCKGKSWISKAIMAVTKAKFSHTAIFIEVWGQPYVVDAQPNGVNLRPFKDWHDKYGYEISVSRRIGGVEEDRFCVKACSKVGLTNYDFKSFLIVYPLYILTGKWLAKETPNDKAMYCSDFAGWCHNVPNHWKMSPKEIYNYFNKSENYYTFNTIFAEY